MTTYATNEFKAGLKVLLNGEPCNILETEFVKPGKGQAFTRVKLRNLRTGRVLEKTCKSGDTLPSADIVEIEMEFLYQDGSFWHFMCPETYEQFSFPQEVMSGSEKWLQPQSVCAVMLWNGQPISLTPPTFIHAKVTHTEPAVRGDTVSGALKSAEIETGATIKVPLFISEGDLVKVDTRTGDYVARVKE